MLGRPGCSELHVITNAIPWEWNGWDTVHRRIYRSSHRRCSLKTGTLKNFADFSGKHMCWSLLLIKSQIWRPATLLKRDSIKSSYFEELLQTTASISTKRRIAIFSKYPIIDDWQFVNLFLCVVVAQYLNENLK